MHEKQKLGEAKFFFQKMADNKIDPDFTFYLSAFLSAARTVLQLLLAECKKRKKQSWYNSRVNNEIIKFFKCKRNFNIHEGTIPQEAKMKMSSEIVLRDSFVAIVHEEGKPPRSISPSEPDEPIRERIGSHTTKRTIHFSGSDVPNDGEVFNLSKSYLKEIENILEAAHEDGIIPN